MKIKNLLMTLAVSVAISSCGSDNNDDNFDAEAQAVKDDVTLVDYLKSHYLDEETSTIGEIKSGEQSLFSTVKTSEIKHNDINYKMYYLILTEGVGAKASKFDSVLVDFSGIQLDSTYFQYPTLDSRIDLTGYLYRRSGPAGMAYASALLKQGNKTINSEESFYFQNSGEGIFEFGGELLDGVGGQTEFGGGGDDFRFRKIVGGFGLRGFEIGDAFFEV